MRVAIVTAQVPFVFGGAEVHAQQLCQALRARGHEAEVIAIPFKWYPPEQILDHLLACRLLDLTESNGKRIDRVIGLKFPAYHVKHPDKVLWILHQHRTAFDLWDSPDADLAYYPEGGRIRKAVVHLEKQLLPEARALFANSRNVASRLKRFCDLDAHPLYHPPQNADAFHGGEADDFLFYPSRICPLKRQSLVLEALAQTRQPVRIRFAGKPDTPEYAHEMEQLARRLGVEKRVQWLGLVSEEEKREAYATCLAVVFPPKDEDYGYISLEAMLSHKAVLTCTDSGGPLEFVLDGETGLVSDATPQALAASMDRCWKERSFAREAGEKGRQRLRDMNVNWDHVIRTLLHAD